MPTHLFKAFYSAFYHEFPIISFSVPCTSTSHQCKTFLYSLIFHLSNLFPPLRTQEINDDLMESWSTLVSQPKPSALQQAQQLSLVKYTAPASSAGCPERTVTTSESRGLILSAGTTGNRTWEAALHLGSFLASETGEALVRGKRVIELGAGTGFLSLVCARHLGVRSVVVTDREPALIDNIRECVKHNLQGRESIPIYPAVWEWGTPLVREGDLAGLGSDEGEEGTGLRFDVALGADLVGVLMGCILGFRAHVSRSMIPTLFPYSCLLCGIFSRTIILKSLSLLRPCAMRILSARS